MAEKRPYKNPQFNLRIPVELKDNIAARAKENGRSLNAEIGVILNDAVNGSFTLQMNEEFGRVYNQLISAGAANYKEFDANNELLDWLIDELAAKIDNDSMKMRELLTMRKESNKKPSN